MSLQKVKIHFFDITKLSVKWLPVFDNSVTARCIFFGSVNWTFCWAIVINGETWVTATELVQDVYKPSTDITLAGDEVVCGTLECPLLIILYVVQASCGSYCWSRFFKYSKLFHLPHRLYLEIDESKVLIYSSLTDSQNYMATLSTHWDKSCSTDV